MLVESQVLSALCRARACRWPGMVEADPDIGEYFLFSSEKDSLPVSIIACLVVRADPHISICPQPHGSYPLVARGRWCCTQSKHQVLGKCRLAALQHVIRNS